MMLEKALFQYYFWLNDCNDDEKLETHIVKISM